MESSATLGFVSLQGLDLVCHEQVATVISVAQSESVRVASIKNEDLRTHWCFDHDKRGAE